MSLGEQLAGAAEAAAALEQELRGARAEQGQQAAVLQQLRGDLELLAGRVVEIEGGSTPAELPPPTGETRDPGRWPFDGDSFWNRGIGSGAEFSSPFDPRLIDVYPAAGTDFADRGGELNTIFYSMPVYQARASDPERMILTKDMSGIIAKIRIPDGAEPAAGTDRHLIIIDPDHRTAFEMFGARALGDGNFRVSVGQAVDLYGPGIAPRAGMNIGIRAYGGSGLAGLIRRWELERGEIRHALAFAVPHDWLKLAPPVWPATQRDGNAADKYKGTIPMGTEYGIPPDVDLDALNLTPQGLAMGRAMQRYGCAVTDAGGGRPTFYAEVAAGPIAGPARDALATLVALLRVVTNNGPDSVGGGGTQLVPPAPPFAVG